MERAQPGAVLNVGGGAEVSMRDVIETLESISGRQLEIVRGPRRLGDQTRTAADTKRIGEQTGWAARTRFVDGLEAQWRWAADRVAAR
jgi:UDP-glucose 4-epimerase